MRSNPSEFELVAPGTLPEVVMLLARDPGEWLPIAGGTDLMVLYAAGKLQARRLVSIWNLPELRCIQVTDDEIRIGSGCTYTDIRKHEIVARELPLLADAAAWTGAIANQNRGTIGGNIVNASPAGDSLPAMLVYEAELILVSVRGERRVPYLGFHTGYKRTVLAPDELIQSICLRRRFSGYFAHTRKVGARNAQAISKVCIAAVGHMEAGVVREVRIALGSVAPFPLRLRETENILAGRPIDASLLAAVRKSVVGEIQPIDDIRSTARYRTAVAINLVTEFLMRLNSDQGQNRHREILARWNVLSIEDAAVAVLPCCGSTSWAKSIVARRPIADLQGLLAAANEVWQTLSPADWTEAFLTHPRIGESQPSVGIAKSPAWSAQEQSRVTSADDEVQKALAEGNREYERRFQRIFIVCATGKSASEILAILRQRLSNDPVVELRESAEQQRQIMEIRLRKWLQE